MFDFGIGSFELMMLAVVAIIVVGPKDLPKLLRTVGQFMTKVRGMASEFRGYLDEAARDTGLDDVKSEVSKMTNFSVDDLTDSSSDVKSAITESAPKPGEKPSKGAAKVKANSTSKAGTPKKSKTAKSKPAKAKAAKVKA